MNGVTRRRIERVASATAIAIVVFLTQYFPDRDDGSGATLAAVFAFAAALVGLAAIEPVRPLPTRSALDRVRLAGLALVAGIAIGIGNLVSNYAIASIDPAIHAQMVEQWTRFSTRSAVFAGPLVEEIAFRLVLMGGVAWLVSRITHDRRVVLAVALAVSAILFGVAHILPSSRPTTGILHATAVAIKSGAAGTALGWVFWRWGLPYSIVCHAVANAVHLVAWPAVF